MLNIMKENALKKTATVEMKEMFHIYTGTGTHTHAHYVLFGFGYIKVEWAKEKVNYVQKICH